MTSTVSYQGALRTSCVHSSGEQIITDAPVDNKGLGAYFSPTDLLATSLASCILTVIGIYCEENRIDFTHGIIEVEKKMAANPRRISDIKLLLDFSGNNWDPATLDAVVEVGKKCPVALTLGDQVHIEYAFK